MAVKIFGPPLTSPPLDVRWEAGRLLKLEWTRPWWDWFQQQSKQSGLYTPTLTNVANLSDSTAYQCQWSRQGQVVTVSGKVDVDPTAGGVSTKLGISLPIMSAFQAEEDCSGVAFAPAVAGQGAAILADVANARAQMQWVSADVANRTMAFIFQYRVI